LIFFIIYLSLHTYTNHLIHIINQKTTIMKKFLSFAVVAFAAVTFVACGNSAPKLEGKEVVKKYFTLIQPTGWTVEEGEVNDNKIVFTFEDSVKYRISVEAVETAGWEHEINFYTNDADFTDPLPAEQDIQAGDITFKAFQSADDKDLMYITKLINADGDGDGKLSVYITTNKYSVDPLQNPIFKDFVANIKLNMKEGEAKAE